MSKLSFQALINGAVLKEWKTLTIKPLLKVAVAEDLNQLKPISTPPKIMAKLLNIKLQEHLE